MCVFWPWTEQGSTEMEFITPVSAQILNQIIFDLELASSEATNLTSHSRVNLSPTVQNEKCLTLF